MEQTTDLNKNRYTISFGDEQYSEDIRTVTAESAETAIEGLADESLDWLRQGDWGPITETTWIHGSVCAVPLDENGKHDTDSDDRANEGVMLQLDPEEPDCVDGEEHDWQSPIELVGGIQENPGVWGHGGGAVITEACMRCGCGKETDTWAQDRSTGIQGLESVSYTVGEFEIASEEE